MKVLVVDDHPFIRKAVKSSLRDDGVDEVIETDNGVDAIQLALQHEPELIILDVFLPRLDGLEVIKRLRERGSCAKILMLTGGSGVGLGDLPVRCLQAGAAGFISKADDFDELGRAVDVIMSGYSYYPKIVLHASSGGDIQADEQQRLKSLSNRERMVLHALVKGANNVEIGETMHISNKTVSTYKSRILEKLSQKTLVDLIDFVKRNEH